MQKGLHALTIVPFYSPHPFYALQKRAFIYVTHSSCISCGGIAKHWTAWAVGVVVFFWINTVRNIPNTVVIEDRAKIVIQGDSLPLQINPFLYMIHNHLAKQLGRGMQEHCVRFRT